MNINYKIGDCREVMKELPDGSFDSCVTDAPYELEFMGKDWDKQGVAYDPDVWREVFRLLKPGAYLLNCGGTRTYDLMVGAVRKADFEIRDMIPWIYGSGFPKSMDISKQIDKLHGAEREVVGVKRNTYDGATRDPTQHGNPADQSNIGKWGLTRTPHGMPETAPATPDAKKWSGYGTALKPAVEPIVVARKPISEKNVAMNVLTHGVGGINVDGCRISYQGEEPNIGGRANIKDFGEGYGFKRDGQHDLKPDTQGRFPANIILECTCEKVIPGKVGTPTKDAKRTSPFFNPDDGWNPHSMTRDKQIAPDDYGDTAPIHTNPNCPCYMLDAQSGNARSSGEYDVGKDLQKTSWFTERTTPQIQKMYADKGGASRFFYVAKASRRERWFYCEVCNKAYSGDKREAHKKHSMKCLDCGVDYEPEYSARPRGDKTHGRMLVGNQDPRPFHFEDIHKSHNTKSNLLFHVTQKPEQLIRYLIRLVTPKGGTVLDPFVGSGTTLVAARLEGMSAYGIEIGKEYEPLISARIEQKSILQFQDYGVGDE